MSETLCEFVDSRGVALKTDREKGVIHGVKILGLQSKNGRVYPKETVARAVPLYEGAKANVNHAAGPRSYGDRIGQLRGVRLGEGESGLFADFHFNPKHALAEQLLWDAEHAPENLGFSHTVEAKISRQKGAVVVEQILSVQSVDLVADPATTRGLFESHTEPSKGASAMELSTLTLAQLRETRGDLIQEIASAAVKEHLGSEDAKKAAAELKTLREEIDRYKAAEALAAKRAGVEKLLEEAKLPKELVTDVFRGTLLEAKDDAAAKALIEDRKTLAVKTAGKPVSREQSLSEATVPKDGQAFARAIS